MLRKFLLLMTVTATLIPVASASAATPADRFAVGTSGGVLGTGSITGDAATIGGSITPAVNGQKEIANVAASAALDAANSQATIASARECGTDETGEQLTGTYTPGVYCWGKSMTSSSGVIIDGNGDSNSEHVFVAQSSVIFTTGTTMTFVNGASPCRTIFVLRGSTKIESGTTLGGQFIATIGSINQEGGSISGRAWALNSTITVGGTVDNTACRPVVVTPPAEKPPVVTPPAEKPPVVTPPVVTPPVVTVPPAPKPVVPKVEPRKPICSATRSQIVITGRALKSVRLGARTTKANTAHNRVRFSVDTRLFSGSKKTLKLTVNFTNGKSKHVKVVAKKCGATKAHQTDRKSVV